MRMEFLYYLLIFIISNPLFAQPNTDEALNPGKVKALVVVYDITYPNNKRPMIKKVDYNKAITIIYGAKIITIGYLVSGDVSTSISNDGNESINLLYPNQRFMLKSIRNEEPKSIAGVSVNRTISATNQKEYILNYDCEEYKMAVVVQTGNTVTTTTSYIYTYSKLDNYPLNYTSVKGISGIPLEMKNDLTNGCIQKWCATSLTEQFVDSTVFNVPSEYLVYTQDEYMQKMITDKAFQEQQFKEAGIEIETTATKSTWGILFDSLIDVLSKQSRTDSYSSPISPSGSSTSFQQEYDQQKRYAREQINRLAVRKGNDEAYGIAGKEYAPTPNPALNVTILRSLQSTQNLMKEIRERAAKQGVYIQKAEEEDVRW